MRELEFRLLTRKEVFGDCNGKGQLDIFFFYWTKCAADDWAVLCGVSSRYDLLMAEGEVNCSEYWLNEFKNHEVTNYFVGQNGNSIYGHMGNPYIGIRPVVRYSDIKDMCFDEKIVCNGIKEVKCFSKPSFAVDDNKQKDLEQKYQDGKLKKIDKKVPRNKLSVPGKEYEAELVSAYQDEHGEIFRRVNALIDDKKQKKLSNGCTYRFHDPVWVKETPQTLIVSEKNDLALFKYVIAGGVCFDYRDEANFSYKDTFMARFLQLQLPMLLEPIEKQEKIRCLEFMINPVEMDLLIENENITLKNISGEEVRIKFKTEKTKLKR